MAGRYGGDIRGKRRSSRKPRRLWDAPRVTPRPMRPVDRPAAFSGAIIAAYGMYLIALAGLWLL